MCHLKKFKNFLPRGAHENVSPGAVVALDVHGYNYNWAYCNYYDDNNNNYYQ